MRNGSNGANGARTHNNALLLTAGVAALCGSVLPAAAQETDNSDEIVVTGTQIRGVAAVGSSPITLGEEAIEASGAFSANELLATIPQTGLFNTLPQGSSGFGAPTVRPNIRGLGASGSSTTLLLLNGQRMAGVGILQTTPDAGLIPPNAIERVEVVTGGGSAIYGADAVGGVINFITRDNFDGTEIGARYGVADSYDTYDLDFAQGLDWATGSAAVSYTYSAHSELLGEDRDYRVFDFTPSGGQDLRSTHCGNVTTGGATTALPDGALRCALDGQLYPKEERHSLFGSLSQELSSSVEFQATAYYSRRETETYDAPPIGGGSSGAGVTINNTNPYFDPIGAETSHVVRFNYGSAFGPTVSPSEYQSYGFTPELIASFNNDWQVRGSLNFAFSNSENHDRNAGLNTAAEAAAIAGTTTATALNPYNVAATDPAVLAAIRNYESYAEADQTQLNGRIVADGGLFSWAGGEVRLAIGGELAAQEIEAATSFGRIGANESPSSVSGGRQVASAFGELFVPIVGAGNRLPFVQSLDLSLAVRYDDYSDFGDTTNPKIGLNWAPIEGLLLRGNWGTSFVAPSLADTEGAVDTRIQVLGPGNIFSLGTIIFSGDPRISFADIGRPFVLIAGGAPDLKPEESESWELGFDWDVPVVDGLRFSATYYNIDYTNQITVPAALALTDPNFAFLRTILPTQADIQTLINGVNPNLPIEGAASIASLYATPGLEPLAFLDARRRNVGAVNTWGVDTTISYQHEMDWGRVFGNLTGTQVLGRDVFGAPGAPPNDAAHDDNTNINDYFFTASLGAEVGQVMARLTTSYTPGYSRSGEPLQDRVDSFQTWDAFVRYNFDPAGPLGEASAFVNVENMFDEEPSYQVNTGGGVGAVTGQIGATVGRLVSVGVRKRF